MCLWHVVYMFLCAVWWVYTCLPVPIAQVHPVYTVIRSWFGWGKCCTCRDSLRRSTRSCHHSAISSVHACCTNTCIGYLSKVDSTCHHGYKLLEFRHRCTYLIRMLWWFSQMSPEGIWNRGVLYTSAWRQCCSHNVWFKKLHTYFPGK